MSKHTYLTVFKRRAKALARDRDQRLSITQEQLAAGSGFASFYELTAVARRDPNDARLMVAAFGMRDLAELIFEDGAYRDLGRKVEHALSGAIAETNAYAFGIEDVDVFGSTFDDDTGQVWLDLTFQYTGEQDPDKVYHGAMFYIVAKVCLHFVQDGWRLSDDDGLEIIECESDRDRDYGDEMEA